MTDIKDLIALDKRHIWHPFTQHKTECDPIAIERAEGALLYDIDGNEILDLISSWWTITHGHSHPPLVAALTTQGAKLSHVMFSGFTHEPAVRLATELTRKLGAPLSKMFFSDNGSTAVEVALKVAFQYWRNKGETERTHFIAFDNAYHGDTFGAMAVGKGSGYFGGFDELLCEVHNVPYAPTFIGDRDVEKTETQAIAALEKTIETHGDKVAALIIEPLFQGAGGMHFCRSSFIKKVTETARAAGILVIFDEVASGFGRTGSLFAHQQCGVKPDMICLSKGITAGMLPLSATIIDEAIYDSFLGDDFSSALAHGHSFTANPLAAAVAVRSLALFEEENTLDKIAIIEGHHEKFAAALDRHLKTERVRVCGSLLAFDLAGDAGAYKSDASLKLRDHYLAQGFNIRPLGGTVYLMPPYCITEEQLSRAYDGVLQGLEII